ncbi:MAG: hypothetical protein NC485_07995 [Ruminococcus flavefaciens]|nr:hypothetical protein [Ruminococcus flavefaciens]MCM1060235.1 hypothetical protein [Eubacterium sp.]
MAEKRLRLNLDNAAKIYPAVRTKKWSNVFRISAGLEEKVDPAVLQSSLGVVIKRFPSIAMGLRKNFFWYHLEEIEKMPEIVPDTSFPCSVMTKADVKKCAFRVLYSERTIAVEFFHSLTDGNGGLIFLKTLLAEYLKQKNGAEIPTVSGVYDINETPDKNELEDSYLKNEGKVSKSRREKNSYVVHGTRTDGFLYHTTCVINTEEALKVAKKENVTLTAFLVSAMIYSAMKIQKRETAVTEKQKPVKILVPVNLRNYFESNSMRNFVLYITPGIKANTGDFTFDEILQNIHHQMKLLLTKKQMQMRITANVKAEKNAFLKSLPLFVKNFGMKMIYNSIGEKKSCLTMSNLGVIKIPKEMEPYIERFDFTLGVQLKGVNNCGILSYKNKLYINMIRSIEESTLEDEFFKTLEELNLNAKIEKNYT